MFLGVDVKVDTGIGKHLSSLGHTLTTLTGEEDEITEDSSIRQGLCWEILGQSNIILYFIILGLLRLLGLYMYGDSL